MASQNYLNSLLDLQTEKSISTDTPNMILYKKMEKIVYKMMEENGGVRIRAVKSFFTSIPDVFTGKDAVNWLKINLDIPDENEDEAVHLGSSIAAHGYIFPIDSHVIKLKSDNRFYRFQTQRYWPSRGWNPDNTEYAVYLCKRAMQNEARLELGDYEAENLARLQKSFASSWNAIFVRAEAEVKNDRKRDKTGRKVADSYERAFWDIHRPVVGSVNRLEEDVKKSCRYIDKSKKSLYDPTPKKPIMYPKRSKTIETMVASVDSVKLIISNLTHRLSRPCIKMSEMCYSLILFISKHEESDPFMYVNDLLNPWLSNDDELWQKAKSNVVTPQRATRIYLRRWQTWELGGGAPRS